jgi:hypothetical protein
LFNATRAPVRISVPSGSIILPVYAGMDFVEDTENKLVVLDGGLRVPVVNVESGYDIPDPEEKTVFIVSEDVFRMVGRRRDMTMVYPGDRSMFLRRDFWCTGRKARVK